MSGATRCSISPNWLQGGSGRTRPWQQRGVQPSFPEAPSGLLWGDSFPACTRALLNLWTTLCATARITVWWRWLVWGANSGGAGGSATRLRLNDGRPRSGWFLSAFIAADPPGSAPTGRAAGLGLAIVQQIRDHPRCGRVARAQPPRRWAVMELGAAQGGSRGRGSAGSRKRFLQLGPTSCPPAFKRLRLSCSRSSARWRSLRGPGALSTLGGTTT